MDAKDLYVAMMVINVIWFLFTIFMNRWWRNYTMRLNDEWSEICENMCSEIEEYYTKGEEK